MTDELILSEDQLNEMAEQLFERVNETVREDFDKAVAESEAADPTVPVLSTTVPETSTGSQLSPVGQEEVAGEIAKGQHDPIVPPQMTRQVWKQMMRMHFTIRRGRAQPCGHKINIEADPRNNCENCWFTYFNNNKTMTEIADDCFQNAGRDILERSRGKKFTRQFMRFMSTVNRLVEEAKQKELDARSNKS